MGKKFVLNADDFGMSKELNKAVLDGYNNGFLSSASLCANGSAFSAAVNDILPECPGIGIGVHLNIIEGKALTNCPMLTDKSGNFNKGYLFFILNSNNAEFLKQVENEFRAQIEKVISQVAVDHIDSHVHVHAIPPIFKLVCNLAREYNIKFVRTQFEDFYLIPSFKKHLKISYIINLIKILLLNFYSSTNKKVIVEKSLQTNDYILGVGYTGMMNSETVEYGLKNIDEPVLVEALIHPCAYSKNIINSHSEEFKITLDKRLEDSIRRMGFEITNYKKL